MRFRFTIKQLETWSDARLLRALVAERQSTCSNIYAPLYKRLQVLYNRLDKEVQAETVQP